jgi:hypothetical protein
MAFTDAGFNFRGTLGYVTDSANQSAVLGESYPTTYTMAVSDETIQAGWTGGNVFTLDRDNVIDVRLAGINWVVNSTPDTFRIDLGATGTHDIFFALGDADAAQAYQYLQLQDNGTPFFTLDASGGTLNSEYYAADSVIYNDTTWPATGSTKKVTILLPARSFKWC